jgi:cobalt/nickel transport system permease protein
MSGLESLGLPRLLALVIQFMYRYVFVLSEQAQHMRMAAQCRSSRGRPGLGAAAGALAVLFARSLARAEAIHRAMLARGFTGQFPLSGSAHVAAADFLFLATAVVPAIALRVAAGWTPQ